VLFGKVHGQRRPCVGGETKDSRCDEHGFYWLSAELGTALTVAGLWVITHQPKHLFHSLFATRTSAPRLDILTITITMWSYKRVNILTLVAGVALLVASTPILASAATSRVEFPSDWTTPLSEGDRVPEVTFLTRSRVESNDPNPFDWKLRTTDDYFKGKRVVVFAIPGAFTPTCSSTHLPGYEAAYDKIRQQGVDDVYCKSFSLCVCVCTNSTRW